MTCKYRDVDPKKAEELLVKMHEQKAYLEQDRQNMNMSQQQYALFRKLYVDMRKTSDSIIDEENPLMRLKNIYKRTYKQNLDNDFADCNALEVIEIKKR